MNNPIKNTAQSGAVRSWGYNFDGQLGNGTNDSVTYPVDVKHLVGVGSIDGGYGFTLAAAE